MFQDNAPHVGELTAAHSMVGCQVNRIEPELAGCSFTAGVHMWRLGTVEAVEEDQDISATCVSLTALE
jgi:hypothetical protein